MDFILANWLLILVALVSGAMLFVPALSGQPGAATVTPAEAVHLMNREKAAVIDVREAAEFATGHIANARHVPLAELAKLLSPCLIRAYSIASHGEAGHIDLCVREVDYEHKGRRHRGTATRFLLTHEGPFRIYCRSNPGFHLAGSADTPLILIGTGTGIAPLMGLLREMQASGVKRENCLIFGEKRRAEDFLYQEELEAMQQEGVLGELITAFSRDGAEKYYVQNAIADHAERLRPMLENGAHVYVCGNKAHLEEAVAQAFDTLMADSDRLPANDRWWKLMQREGRVHLELY